MTYFEWLVRLILDDDHPFEQYHELLRLLYSTDFYWILPEDADRAGDGLTMRDIYLTYVEDGIPLAGPCTMLEMMVAMAKRAEDEIMYDPEFGERTPVWFWAMIDSLALSDQTTGHFCDTFCKKMIEKCLSRQYDEDGFGSLFWVKTPKYDTFYDTYDTFMTLSKSKVSYDCTQIVFWRQMQIWLNAHFSA